MDVTLLLCDWAEEINGKLYIMGGGWSRILLAQPASMALAVKVMVPWNEANRRHAISASLLDQDGKVVNQVVETESGRQEQLVQLVGEMEVGRPPGMRPGSPIDAPMVMRFNNLALPAGRYVWSLKIDGEEKGTAPFEVVVPSEAERR